MIKLLFTLLFLQIFLEARDNPFFPSKGELDIPVTSNQVEILPKLKNATISLPSTARNIESITIKYKNLDGSVSEKKQEIDNSIDWHLPIFVSQSYNLIEKKAKQKVKKKIAYKKIASLKYINVYDANRDIKVLTKDKMIRDFMLTGPHRIVCDFKRDIDSRSFEKIVKKNSIVKRVKLGNHDGYYRVVIELDGHYKYKSKKADGGYIFNLM